jgi:hypothetical protein
MTKLDEFFKAGSQGERVVGTYLYPYRIFSQPNWDDPYSATEIIMKINVESHQVLLTRNGGLCLQPPSTLSDSYAPDYKPGLDFDKKILFQEEVARALNWILCEFAMHGIVSNPVTPVHLARGLLINNHALLGGGVGGREIYLERTNIPVLQLIQGIWRMYPVYPISMVDTVAGLQVSSQLGQISENLPTFIVSAYSLFSQQQNSEALVDSWIAVEQIIDWLWNNYLSQIADAGRAKRLSDTRTYSVAVRIEILHSVGVLPSSLYNDLNSARRHRNDLAHRAKSSLNTTTTTLTAMKQLIEFVCKTTVEPPLPNVSLSW